MCSSRLIVPYLSLIDSLFVINEKIAKARFLMPYYLHFWRFFTSYVGKIKYINSSTHDISDLNPYESNKTSYTVKEWSRKILTPPEAADLKSYESVIFFFHWAEPGKGEPAWCKNKTIQVGAYARTCAWCVLSYHAVLIVLKSGLLIANQIKEFCHSYN